MTDDRELSFILDRSLSDGPTEMPDRVIDVVAMGEPADSGSDPPDAWIGGFLA